MNNLIYLKAIAALAFVISLILLVAIIARKFNLDKIIKNQYTGKRLSVEEILPIDNKRKLFLIKRDDTHHLILLTPTGELIIETNIKADCATS